MLLPAGIILYDIILCYLYKVVYVISGMNATEEVRCSRPLCVRMAGTMSRRPYS